MSRPCWRPGSRRGLSGPWPDSSTAHGRWLDVIVQSFTISSAVQRILIGGGHGMVADANLVDARTGAVIISHPRLSAVLLAGQGVLGTAVEAAMTNGGATTLDRIVDTYGGNYRDWLLRRA